MANIVITKQELSSFKEGPCLLASFFASGIELRSHQAVSIACKPGKDLEIVLDQVGPERRTIHTEFMGDPSIVTIEFDEANNTHMIRIAIPKGSKGKSALSIYWSAGSAARQLLLTYQVTF
mmetsp:Transcript_33756/g.55729  ORF Transcript_33756/g.55729 Transcript_33756/m.55729 type:complete len:121 (-) Transcript_33756:141-503(-)